MDKDKLKSLRNELGLSVKDASNQVHISQRSWSRYEDGTRPIPEGIVELFCIKNNIDYPDQ